MLYSAEWMREHDADQNAFESAWQRMPKAEREVCPRILSHLIYLTAPRRSGNRRWQGTHKVRQGKRQRTQNQRYLKWHHILRARC